MALPIFAVYNDGGSLNFHKYIQTIAFVSKVMETVYNNFFSTKATLWHQAKEERNEALRKNFQDKSERQSVLSLRITGTPSKKALHGTTPSSANPLKPTSKA